MGAKELLAFTQMVLAKFQFNCWSKGMYSSTEWESTELLMLQTHVPAVPKKSEEPPDPSEAFTQDVALHCWSSMVHAWIVQAFLHPWHEVDLSVTYSSCSLAWIQYPYACPGGSFSPVCEPRFWVALDYLSIECILVINKISYIWLSINFIKFRGNICKADWDLLLIKRPDVRPLASLYPGEWEIKKLNA